MFSNVRLSTKSPRSDLTFTKRPTRISEEKPKPDSGGQREQNEQSAYVEVVIRK